MLTFVTLFHLLHFHELRLLRTACEIANVLHEIGHARWASLQKIRSLFHILIKCFNLKKQIEPYKLE